MRVAVKLAYRDPSRLEREAQALAAIGPPHVPVIFESGTVGRLRYLVLEYLPPPTLAQRLEQLGGPMELKEFAQLSTALFAAVEATHRHGWVHRDLKPENVFVGSRAKLIDFGLVSQPGAPASMTAAGAVIGTPEYMSPEQCQSALVDYRADLYSLGVILYEMVTGRVPFFGSRAEVEQAHVARRPPVPSEFVELPEGVADAILRCLAKDPKQRFDSIRDLIVEFERVRGCRHVARRTVEPTKLGATRDERPQALLFFSSSHDLVEIRRVLSSLGGQVAHSSGSNLVAVFGSGARESAVDRAAAAAKSLVDSGLTTSVLVDRAQVTCRSRADGSVSFFSPLFGDAARFRHEWSGVRMSAAASTALQAATPAPTSEDDLVGRQELLQALVAGARQAITHSAPTIATVLGDAGYGKTRLCQKLMLEVAAGLPAVQRFEMRAVESMSGESPNLRMLIRVILDLPAEPAGDQGKALLSARLGPMFAPQWGVIALSLGWIANDSPELCKLGAAPGALRSATVRALGEALRRRATISPVCVVLDDAHLADPITLDVLEYAALSEGHTPLWVCVLARPSFRSLRQNWAERADQSQLFQMTPLNPQAAAELCRHLLEPAESIPQRVVERLVERTQGIPFLLVELVRGLKRDGLVRKRAQGPGWFVATDEIEQPTDLPLVDWLADRELSSFAPELRAHAQLLAALGPEFFPIEAEGVLAELEHAGRAASLPLDARVAINRLIGAELLVQSHLGSARFRHALVRDAICRTVPPTLSHAIHVAAFRYYQGAVVLTDSERLARLAFHAANANLITEASRLYLKVAELARARHAYLEAEQAYSRALDHLQPTETHDRLLAWKGRGIMRYRLGRSEDSLADFACALEIATRLQDNQAAIEILLDQATAFDWLWQFEQSRLMIEQAEALAAVPWPAHLQAALLMAKGRSLWRANRLHEAREVLEQAVSRAEKAGDAAYETLVVSLLMLGHLLPLLRLNDRAEEVFARALELCKECGDQLHLAALLVNRLNLCVARNEPSRAIQDQLESVRIERELGMVTSELHGEYNLTELHYHLGDLASARSHLRRALAIHKRHPGDGTLGVALSLLEARLLAYEGRTVEARAILERLQAQQAPGEWLPPLRASFDMVHLAAGRASESVWLSLVERVDALSLNDEHIEILEFMAIQLARLGKREEAKTWMARALDFVAQHPTFLAQRLRVRLESLNTTSPS